MKGNNAMKGKLKAIWKRAVSGMLAAITVMSTVAVTPAFAAGNTATMSFDYCYDSAGNTIVYAADLVINGHTVNEAGKPRYKIMGDGEEAYCIQPGVSLHTGNQLTANASDTWDALNSNQQNALKLVLTYGRPGNSKNLSGTAGEQYVATQAIVWEIVKGYRNSTGSYKRVNDGFYNSFFAGGKNSGTLKVYKEIEAAMAAYSTVPSFMSGSKSNAESYQLDWDGSNYTVTLTDSNKCLSNYSFTSSDSSVKVSVSGNKLTITSSKQVVDAVTITATGKPPTLSSSAKLVAYGAPSLQDVVIGVELPNKMKAYAKVETAVGSFKLVKTSEDGKVSGVKFHISGNGIEKDVKTGTDGTITVDKLTVGVYTITEQPEDYYVQPSAQKVTIASGRTATVTFSNELKRSDLEVTKDSEDGMNEGVTFHLYGTSQSGHKVDEYAVTGADGIARFENVLISSAQGYTLEEVDTKEYYIVPAAQTVAVEWNKVAKHTVRNELKRGDLSVTKSSEDGMNSDVTFKLSGTSLSGAAVMAYSVTDENGVAVFKDILISDADGYTLEEVETALKYVVPESQTLPIYWNDVTKTTVTNVLKKFCVQVDKTDIERMNAQGDATLAGAVYGIYKGGELVDTYTTDSQGRFTTAYYVCGDDWTIREISPSEGYLLDETVYPVGASASQYTIELNTTYVGVYEQVKKGSIQIVKHTDDENPDVNYEKKAPEETEVSEETEAPAETEVPTETEVPVETEAPAESESEAVESEPETEISEEETQPTEEETETESMPAEETEAAVLLLNHTVKTTSPAVDVDNSGIIEKPEQGAVFEVYLRSAGSYADARETERDILTTDENGYAKTKDLPYGVYVVHQIEGEEGKAFVKDFSVFIDENGKTYYYILNNRTITSHIRVEKRDMETGNLIAASSIGFQIYDASGNLITQDIYYPTPMVLDTFYTNEEGWLMLPETLPYGSYSLVEVQTAHGYVLDREPVEFQVDGSETVVTVTKKNIAQKGTITVTKTGENFSSVMESKLPVLDKNGIAGDDATVYTPVYTVCNLSGAVYEVTAAEDIYTLDGTLRAKAGEVVATIQTDAEGKAVTDLLYLGKYTVTEVTAPYGMVIASDAVTVELAYAGQEAEVTETSAAFYNERQKVSVSVDKLLEVDETFGVGNRGEIQNVAFALYSAGEKTAADGTVIPDNGLIEVKFCDKDGKITFAADLPLGDYYVKEFATDCHYLISDAIYPVSFTYAGQDKALVALNANDGEAIENELLRGEVQGLKLSVSEEPLEGALFGLFRINAEQYTEEFAILTAVSDAEGRFQFQNIPYGDYVVRELKAPESYAVNDNNYYVSIGFDGQTIGVKVLDEKIVGSLEITKTDVTTGELIPNCGFEILDADMNVIVQGYTDENGIAAFPDLEYGDYFYREFDAPAGYLIDEEVYPFAIREHHEVVKAEMTNQKIIGSLELTKKDVSDGALIPNCGVEILDKDGNVVVQGKTDENGVIVFDHLEYGDYFYREYDAPEGYVLDETAYPFSIKEDGEIVKAEMTNRKIEGTLELTKKDVANGKALPNAGFRIYDEEGNIVAEGKTDKNGVAVFKLTYGKYSYQEYDAPEGYQIDDSLFPFEIKKDGEIVKAEMTNQKKEEAPKPEDQGPKEDTPKPSNPDTPKTGDDTPVGLYLGLLGLSAVAVGGAVILGGKKKRKKKGV